MVDATNSSAEERLVSSETLVRNILDTAMDGIISMDSHQNVILFNAAAEAIFGWRADQVLGHKIDRLIPERFRSPHQSLVSQFDYAGSRGRRSEPGVGSKFSTYLPATLTSEKASSTPTDVTAESGHGRTVLIVDDEAFILQMTSAALEAAGYRVLTAQDGSAALATFRQHRHEISAVLLDIMMPGLDGLQTLDELRKLNPRVTVIACSGLRTTQRESEVFERGATAFLPKPYSDDQLLQTLAELLKRTNC